MTLEVGKAAKATDWLLDQGGGYMRLANHYERQLDAAADLCFDALQAEPQNEWVKRISKALTD